MTSPTAQPFLDDAEEPHVRGFLHRAASTARPPDALVLTHGAGGDCNSQLLVALAEGFSAVGLTVLRCDLPFRQRRPHGPPSPATAKTDQEGLRRAVAVMKKLVGGRVFLGGQSYGGRQASMLAASDPSVAQALVLFSYPLHPPGRPHQLRTAHLPKLQTPALFVSGTRDPFGTIDELEEARKLVPAPTRLIAIDGAGHSLLTKKNRPEVVSVVVTEFLRLVRVS